MKSMSRSSRLVASALLVSLVAACGGGGGDSTPVPASAAAPTPTAPTPTAPTPPALAPAPAPALLPGAETLPSLNAPQAGSTATGTAAAEGIYLSRFGFAFITSAGDIFVKEIVGNLFGSISLTPQNAWTFNAGSKSIFVGIDEIAGSGTATPRTSFKGTYNTVANASTTPSTIDLTYSPANALAVTQSSVSGNWGSGTDIAFAIDSAGSLSGTTAGSQLGICTLVGSIALQTPNSSKNLYNISFTASGANCKLEVGNAYSGFSAIEFTSAGNFVANGYFRNLAFLLKTSSGSTLSSVTKKQS
jgi:hypothetical protein